MTGQATSGQRFGDLHDWHPDLYGASSQISEK